MTPTSVNVYLSDAQAAEALELMARWRVRTIQAVLRRALQEAVAREDGS